MKLLIVYNTCGLRGNENIVFYVDCLRSLISQRVRSDIEVKICVSACAASDMWKIQSRNTFQNHISYSFIEDNVPLSVSFNASVDKMVQHYGAFDAYLYIDSGISFWDPSLQCNALQKMINVHEGGPNIDTKVSGNGPYAITAALASNDDGRQWLGWDFEGENTEFIFPVGKTTNMHCQLFSEEWRQAYNRILPDIFASHTMESVFSFMAAAIKKKFVITRQVQLLHLHSLDGASSGSRSPDLDRIPCSDTFESGGLLFKTKKTMDKRYREGFELGFGWEECKPYWKHDPSCYSENGDAKDERLKIFLAKELYLSKEEFDYDSLKTYFFP